MVAASIFSISEPIGWSNLSENPAAIHLLLQNPDKIDWKTLSCNYAAIEILRENIDKIDWIYLQCNSSPDIDLLLNDIK